MAWGFVAGAAISVVGGAIASDKASSSANKAADKQLAAVSDETQLSRDQFDWNKLIYDRDTKPMQEKDAELREKLINSSLESQEQQQEFAKDQNDYYKEVFQPLEREVVNDANNYDSAANIERRSGQAAANVNQQFSNSAAQRARLLGRYGLNPNSSTFAAQAGADSRAQALGAAGAATGAAFDTEDKAIALRAGAANFGRNMPNTAASYYAGSQAAGNSAGNTSSGGLSNQIGSLGPMNAAYSNRFNQIGTIGNTAANAYNSQASMWGNVAQGLGRAAGAAIGGINSSPSWGDSMTVDQYGYGIDSSGYLGGSTAGDYSDARLKTDVRRVATRRDGLGVYEYRYRWGGPLVTGLMAHEVERVYPHAVTVDREGFKMVNYARVH